jgi:hypothetical protein
MIRYMPDLNHWETSLLEYPEPDRKSAEPLESELVEFLHRLLRE